MRIWLRVLCTLLLLCATAARAQTQAPKPSATPALAGPAATTSAASSADIEALIRVLRDDKARAALLKRLEGGTPAATTPAPTPTATQGPAKTETLPPSPDFATSAAAYTDELALRGARFMMALGQAMLGAGDIVEAVFSLDPARLWPLISEVLTVLVVVLAVGLMARRLSFRVGRTADARGQDAGLARRLLLLLAAGLMDAAGVCVAWAVGYGVALSMTETGRLGFGPGLLLNAFLAIELGKVLLRLPLVPSRPRLRLLPMGDTTAGYWYFWTSRLVSLLGYGVLFVAPLVQYSGDWAAAHSIRVLAMFAATVLVVVVILRSRADVRAALSRPLDDGRTDMLARLAAQLGAVWHFIAVAYAAAVFLVWLTYPRIALPYMLWATAQSVAVGGLGAAIGAGLSRLVRRGVRLPEAVTLRLPLLERRLNRLIPVVLRAVRLVVLVVTLLGILHAWGLMAPGSWLASDAARPILGGVVSAGLIVLLGGLAYIAMASWVEYRLNPDYGSVPTARERTLLALLRNAVTIALAVLVLMLALAQIGISIAPLLAGAGVVGLAIGFGAQKLVQDIITGVFIQFENAFNEGEVVRVGDVAGVVEKLTIRSVSIRDLDGILHIVPFSSVDKVSNFMRHFSYHVAAIGVAYRENVAEVKAAMQEAFERLQATEEHGPNILGPLDMQGLVEFADSAMIVRARIKTLPGKHWGAGRAYNEFIKEIFDERGIEIPFPHVTLYMGEDKKGNAPPLRVRAENAAPMKPTAPEKPVEDDRD